MATATSALGSPSTRATLPVAACVVGTALIGVAYVLASTRSAPIVEAWLMVLGVTVLAVGFLALGIRRRGARRGVFRVALAFAAAACLTGFGIALWLPADESATSRLVLGFPIRAALVLYVVGVLPLFILPAIYAFTFDADTLTDADLAKLRAGRPAPTIE